MLFDFVWEHTDTCPRCSRCDWCDEGKRLLREAAKAAGDAITYGILGKPPEAKA